MGSVESYETARGRRYRVRYRRPDRTQTTKRGFSTKREADNYLATVEVSKMRGEWLDPSRSKVSVADVAVEWIAGQVQIKPSTLSGYRYTLDRHILPTWGSRRLVEIGHGEVQAWITTLTEGLAPSTVRQIYFVLAALMKYSVRDGRINRDPTDGVQMPRKRATDRGYLSHEQVASLARECDGHADLIAFLAYTGLRWGEMAALKVSSIDFSRRRVDVKEALTDVRGTLVRGTPKTHERRSVPFPAFLGPPLRARAAGKQPQESLFVSSRGLEMRNGNFRKRVFLPALRRLQEHDAGFPTVTVHDLRHTAASLAISAGANVKAVQRMLGHASAAMTLDVYADLFDDDLDHVAGRLDEAASEGVAKMWSSPSPGQSKTPAMLEARRGFLG